MANLATINNNLLADSGIDPIDLIVGTGTVNYIPKFSAEGTIANSQIFDNGTNVGISTNNPLAKLHIVYAGDDNPGIRLQGDGNDTNLEFRTNNSYASIQAYDSGFVTAGNLSINSLGGNVAIGKNQALTKLEIAASNNLLSENNTLRFTDTDTATEANQQIGKIEFYSSDTSTPGAGVKAYIGAFASDSTPDAYIAFATQDGGVVSTPVIRALITSTGNLLVGQTTDDVNYLFQLNGVSRSKGEALLGNFPNLTDFGQVGIYATNVGWTDGFGTLVISGRHDEQRPILFTTYNGTSVGERVRIAPSGVLRLTSYGSGSITGTPTYRLAVDSVGNIIEVTDGGGTITGGGTAGQVAFFNGSSSIASEANFTWDGSNNVLTTDNGRVEFRGVQQDAVQSILTLAANNAAGQVKGLYIRLIAGGTPEWQFITGAVSTDAGIKIIPNGSNGLTVPFGTTAASFSNSLTVGDDLTVTDKVGIGGSVGTDQLFVYNAMAKLPTSSGWGVVVQDTNTDGLAGRGGAIAFGAYRTDSGRFNTAAVAGAKSNSTGGNENGDLVLYSSVASSLTERVRVLSAGRTLMGPTMPTDDGSSALQVSGGNIRANEQVVTYRRFVARFNDTGNLCAELYEDGASTNGGTLALYGKASGTVDTVISAAPTKLNYINNAANVMIGWNTDQGYKIAANGSGWINGDLQVGSSSVTSVSLRISRTNASIPADANYFVATSNTPVQSWIEGGYFTGELAGQITAPNSGYPYFEVWAGQGSATNKSFGFVNKTSGAFTSANLLYTFSLLRTGQIRFNQYGSGTFTGTRAYDLAIDSSGNIIEVAVGAGTVTGSGTTNRLSKWTSSSSLGDANITDNGTTVRVNTIPLLVDSRLGIGVAGNDQNYAYIFIGGDLAVGATQSGILLDPQLAGTTNSYAIYSNARIKASTAVANAYGLYITNAEKLLGATITNNFGLYIANQTSGSTQNYAIYSAGGTNYFGGRVGIGTDNPGAQLHVNSSDTLVANFNCTSNGTYLRWQNNGTSFGDIGSAASLVSGGSTNDFTIHARSTYSIVFAIDFATKMLLNASGNLGLNVIPSTWSLGKAIEVGSLGNGIWNYGVSNTNIVTNVIWNAGHKYASNGAATQYAQNNGNHEWLIAASGTAGAAVSFTQAMTLNASGNLSIGNTNNTYKLDVSNGSSNVYARLQTSGTSNYATLLLENGDRTWYTTNNADGNFDIGTGADPSDNIKLTLNSSGNLGLAVVPAAWRSINTVLQIKNTAIWNESNSISWFANNTFENASGQYIYINGSGASAYNQFNGVHTFYTAASGTAGTAISFAPSMILNASGNLGIGTSNLPFKVNIESSSETTARIKSTSPSGAARLILNPEGAGAGSTGDGSIFFDMHTTAWVAGVDKSDASRFKIAVDPYGDFRAGVHLSIDNVTDRSNVVIGGTTAVNNTAGRGNLTINGTSTSILNFTVGSSEKGYLYHNNTAMQLYNVANGEIQMGANNVQLLTLKPVVTNQCNVVVGHTGTALAGSSNRANLTLNGASNAILSFGVADVLKGYLYHNSVNFFMNHGAGSFIFESDTATAMTITTGGFVGIRTTPSYQLSVNGAANGIDFETNTTSTYARSIFFTTRETGVAREIGTTGGYSYGPSNPLTMVLTQTSDTPIAMFRASDDAVGAGLKGYKSRGTVALPVSVNNGDTIFSMEGWAFHGSGPNNAKFGAGMRFVKEDAFGTANTYAPQRTEFYNAVSTTAVQTNVVIYPNGNTTVGTSTYYGSYKLSVEGNLFTTGYLRIETGASDSQIIFKNNASGNPRSLNYNVADASITFNPTSGAATAIFANNGNATFTGSCTATSFFESSDSRIKKLLNNSIDYLLIADVEARYYEKNGVQELGYFAQDFEQILPSAIHKDEKGLLNLSYTQVHTAKIAALEKEVRELKEQLKNK